MHAEPAVQRLPDQDQLPAESVLDDVTGHAALSACGELIMLGTRVAASKKLIPSLDLTRHEITPMFYESPSKT
jgi:hypothetical protein